MVATRIAVTESAMQAIALGGPVGLEPYPLLRGEQGRDLRVEVVDERGAVAPRLPALFIEFESGLPHQFGHLGTLLGREVERMLKAFHAALLEWAMHRGAAAKPQQGGKKDTAHRTGDKDAGKD